MSVTITPTFTSVLDISCIRTYNFELGTLLTYLGGTTDATTKVVIKSTTFPDASKITVSSNVADPNIIIMSPFLTIIDAIEYPGIVNGKTYQIVYNIQNSSNVEIGNVDGTIKFRYYIEEYGLENTVAVTNLSTGGTVNHQYLGCVNINNNTILLKELVSNNLVRTFDISNTGNLIQRPDLVFGANDRLASISVDGNTIAQTDTGGFRFKEWNGTSYTDLPILAFNPGAYFSSFLRSGVGVGNPGKLYYAIIGVSNVAGTFGVINIDSSNNITNTSIPGVHLGSFYGGRFKFFMSDDFEIVSSVTTSVPGTFNLFTKVYENIGNNATAPENWSLVSTPIQLTTGNNSYTPNLPLTFEYYSDPYDETSTLISRTYFDPVNAVTSDRTTHDTSICKKDSSGVYHLMIGFNEYVNGSNPRVYTFSTFLHFKYDPMMGGNWVYIGCLPNLRNLIPSGASIINYGCHIELSNECDRFYISPQVGNPAIPAFTTPSSIYFKRNTTTNKWLAYGNYSQDFVDRLTPVPVPVTKLLPSNPTKRLSYVYAFPNKNIDTLFVAYYDNNNPEDTYLALLDNSPPIARNDTFPTNIDVTTTTTQLFTPKDGYGVGQNDYMNDNLEPTLVITNYDGITPADISIDNVNGTFTIDNLDTYTQRTYNIEYLWENEFGVQGNTATLTFTLISQAILNNDSFEVYNNVISTLDILANDTNASGGVAVIVTDPNSSGVTINGSNQAVIPSGLSNGVYTFTYDYEISSVPTGSPATVTVTVVDPIVLNGDPGTGGPVNVITSFGGTIDILANDTGVTGRTPSIITNIIGGTVTINGSNIAVVPSGLAGGNYSFTYDVSFNGGVTGSPATVNFTIGPGNPVLNPDGPTEVFNNNITLLDILSNDQNINNGIPVIITDPNSTGVTINGSNQAVIPSGLTNGNYTFTYDVEFGGIPTGSPTTVDITVVDPIILVNDPDVPPISFNQIVGGTIDILANDSGVAGRTPSIITNIIGGTVTINGSNQVVVPAGLSGGNYSFTYDVSFNGGVTGNPATVNFIIVSTNPLLPVDDLNVDVEYTGGVIEVINNDIIGTRDPDTDVNVVITSNIPGGNPVTVSNNKLVIPTNLSIGTYTLQYDLEDVLDSNNPTGTPGTVTFNIIVSSSGGSLPAGNPADLSITPNTIGISDQNVTFVRGVSLSREEVKDILTGNYTGTKQVEVEEIIDYMYRNFIKSGNISHSNTQESRNIRTLVDNNYTFTSEMRTFN